TAPRPRPAYDPRRSLGSRLTCARDGERRHPDRWTEGTFETQPRHEEVIETRLDARDRLALQHAGVQEPARHAQHVEVAQVLDGEPRAFELARELLARVAPMVVDRPV